MELTLQVCHNMHIPLVTLFRHSHLHYTSCAQNDAGVPQVLESVRVWQGTTAAVIAVKLDEEEYFKVRELFQEIT